MIISLAIAWLITNGWAYIFIAIGNHTLRTIGISYVAFLWLPFSVEKVVTIAIAVWLEKIIIKCGHLKQKSVEADREGETMINFP
jgi:hypothetical protein